MSRLSQSQQRKKFTEWLSDGESWIGVFENQLLGDPHAGERIAMAFDNSDYDKARFGMRAPDTRELIGWRYTLVAKCRTVDCAVEAMAEEFDHEPDVIH